MSRVAKITGIFILLLSLSACATKKKKGEVSWLGKLYHNTTAKFNGYYNANVLLEQSFAQLDEQHEDNYNQVLDVYTYTAVENPQSVAPELDRAIEKVTTVAALHEPSHWVDDCYLLMGKAQYLKQDYESAEETLEYFVEEFNPYKPGSRLYKSYKKDSKADRRKEAEREREAKRKEKEEERKKKEEEKELKKKQREEEKKQKEKERERKKKEREKAKKDRKKKKRSSTKKRRTRTKKEAEAPKQETTVKDTTAATTPEKTAVKKVEAAPPPKPKMSDDEEWALAKPEDDAKSKPKASGGGLFKHQIAYHEGVLWLAKTYIEREKFIAAESLLNKLQQEAGLPKDVLRELPVARAYLYLKQKKYSPAIPALEEAIESAGNKRDKARYAYIQAQIYQQSGMEAQAQAAFERAKKFSPSYEMDFNAALSVIRNAWVSGSESTDMALKQLEKLMKDKKNSDFRDQIYFTQAQIKLASNDEEGAIADFKSSLQYNTLNKSQKIESYYSLASLYYGFERYVPAKNYFDSTFTLMPKTDERYPNVEKLSKNLNDIARNIQIIELQDSLLHIADLPEDKKRELAAKILEERRQNEVDNKGADVIGPASNQVNRVNVRAGQRSSFFAYNPIVMEQGKRDFESRWGRRKLEDDWRRSGKHSSLIEDDLAEEEDVDDSDELTDQDVQAVFRDVPRNAKQKLTAHRKIESALFELGTLYRDRIQNYPKSIESLEALLQRYPETEKEMDALFYLYLSNLDKPDAVRAEHYKQLLIERYPGTKYASALQDPDFAQTLREKEESLATYYDETYAMFTKGDYTQVIRRVDEASNEFGPKNALSPKFALLHAMALGHVQDKDAYIAGLRDVIAKYPNSPEETRAREILRFLQGDEKAFDPVLYEEALQTFNLQDDRLHYIVFFVNNLSEDQVQQMKSDIVRYNRKYHKLDRLRAPQEIYIDRDTKAMVVLLRKFSNRDKAMKYYDGVQKNKGEFIDDTIPYEMFAATQQNYREILKQKSVNNYRLFFEKEYLDQE